MENMTRMFACGVGHLSVVPQSTAVSAVMIIQLPGSQHYCWIAFARWHPWSV